MQAARITTCQTWEKYVAILIDELYIRQDLVFEKCTGKLIGFVSLGDVNDHLLAFENSKLLEEDCCGDKVDIAKTMVVFMVLGLFSRLWYPYAQFPCLSVTGDLLY